MGKKLKENLKKKDEQKNFYKKKKIFDSVKKGFFNIINNNINKNDEESEDSNNNNEKEIIKNMFGIFDIISDNADQNINNENNNNENIENNSNINNENNNVIINENNNNKDINSININRNKNENNLINNNNINFINNNRYNNMYNNGFNNIYNNNEYNNIYNNMYNNMNNNMYNNNGYNNLYNNNGFNNMYNNMNNNMYNNNGYNNLYNNNGFNNMYNNNINNNVYNNGFNEMYNINFNLPENNNFNNINQHNNMAINNINPQVNETQINFKNIFGKGIFINPNSNIPFHLNYENSRADINKKIYLNILYYDEGLKTTSENNSNCSFFKISIKGTFYGCHNFNLFKYICEKIKNTKKNFILISSGSSAETIFSHCSYINEFTQYYIYCLNKKNYEPLLKKYSKLKGIYTLFNDLKKELLLLKGIKEENIKSSNLFYFNDYNKIYIKLHYEIIRKYTLYKLLKDKNQSNFLEIVKKKSPYYQDLAKQLIYNDENEMINYFIKNTNENQDVIKKIFSSEHNIQNYIKNYTLESFYYKYLNKFLREGNFEFFKNLSNHISKFIYHLYEYRKKNINKHNNQSNLYRYMLLTQEDLNVYLKSIGKVICYPSFTSTSIIENGYIPNSNNNNEKLVKLIINQNNSKSVVSISELSNYPDEKEYLFLPFSFFKIINVILGGGNEDNPHLIYLMALNSDKPIEDIFLDFMKEETDNLDPQGLDMLKLCNSDTKIILNPMLLSNY